MERNKQHGVAYMWPIEQMLQLKRGHQEWLPLEILFAYLSLALVFLP